MGQDEMMLAGKLSQKYSWTDEELQLAITGTTLALAYLKGRGLHFGLAISALTVDLEQLLRFKEARITCNLSKKE